MLISCLLSIMYWTCYINSKNYNQPKQNEVNQSKSLKKTDNLVVAL
uniref:Uncharacterized protein n=1 Tax=Arundo donax TaxID=35708 RepID=A0A0A8ZAN4_ARUDO